MNFYSEEQLEELADSINNEHCPERMNAVLPLDPYHLLEKLGLEVEWKFISPSKDILGMVFFEDAIFPIWEKRVL